MSSSRLALLAATLTLICVGCAQDPGSPYKPERGPFVVRVENPVVLAFPELNKDLQLRIAFPDRPGAYPLIVFSHGGRLSKDDYTEITDHWVSHGYVVIQPTHMDSTSLGFDMAKAGLGGMMEVARTRRQDLRFILDSLDRLMELVPPLAERVDRERIVAAGHSMGGATALTVTGLELVDPRDGSVQGFADERFDGLLLLSEPGNNPIMPADPWRAVPVPTFVGTGSRDYSSRTGKRPSLDKRFYSLRPDLEMPDSPHHYLFIDEMDHYLGGIVASVDADHDPDYEALEIFNGVSTAFLDAYTKDHSAAMKFLSGGALPVGVTTRATLERR